MNIAIMNSCSSHIFKDTGLRPENRDGGGSCPQKLGQLQPSPELRLPAVRRGIHVLDRPFESYQGGKLLDGIYHKIINKIPFHDIYIEPYLGGGGIFLMKKLASYSYLGEANPDVFAKWNAQKRIPTVSIQNILALDLLKSLEELPGKKFVYLDPPYPHEVRAKLNLYGEFEMSIRDHEQLLDYITQSRPGWMYAISSYENRLYESRLQNWEKIRYLTRTRGATKEETLYMSYDIEDFPLHDYSYVGKNRKRREQIHLKQKRLIEKLAKMPAREREAILHTVNNFKFQ